MMKKFRIDDAVFEKLQNYCVGIVVAKGVNNKNIILNVEEMLNNEINKFSDTEKETNVRELVAPYRDAFYALEMNPNKYMCSIEALLKRVQKAGNLPHINTIVDLGNVFSVKYRIPLGAHDIDKLDDDLVVRFSNAQDTFLPLGESETEYVQTSELVYVCKNTIKTRRWIWRQSNDGKITEDTCNVFFPIDGFVGKNEDKVIELRDELAEFLKNNFHGINISTGFADRNHNEYLLGE